jgi:sulfur-oxidizing protein SoxB
VRAPYKAKLGETLAVSPKACCTAAATSTARGDQLIVDALMEAQGAEIAFSPGFRWGTTLLPGEAHHARMR